MSVKCSVLNGACKLLYRREYRRFTAPCDIGRVQGAYLKELLLKNADTVYGRKYGFDTIRSYRDFTRLVPLTEYEDYEPYIDRMCRGERDVLTAEEILLFELTSGSSGGKKLIPYTPSLKQEFQRGIRPWLYDIYDKIEGVSEGRSYWSITPVTAEKQYAPCGIPIGFEEDAEYFGRLEKGIMGMLFAVGSEVKFVSDMQDFYRRTSSRLLNCEELSLISVWNPTFLTILCDFMADHAQELARMLPPRRRALFREAVRGNRFDRLFPKLKLISCWADGSAADYVEAVRKRFPSVYIEPKGLLATECFTSFPLAGEEGSRLSIYSHFFEFRSLADNQIYPAHKLQKGEYELIVTTGGGFYRYCIGDIIEVLETYRNRPPRIRFLRRKGVACDLFGEKLTEGFVHRALLALGIGEYFGLLAPEGNRYCLYTTAEHITEDMLDKALRESYHYDYCRSLNQLEKAAVRIVSGNPQKDYIRRLSQEGMRIGDIKPAHLSGKRGWEEWFEILRIRKDILPC